MEGVRSSKVRRALTEPLLIAGAERSLCLINIGVLLFTWVSLRVWWWTLGAFLIHIVLVYVAKDDADMRKIYIRYSLQGDKYDPWPHVSQRRGRRPLGFGQGETC